MAGRPPHPEAACEIARKSSTEHSMSAMSPRATPLLAILVVLQLATLFLVAAPQLGLELFGPASEDELTTGEDVAEEISLARYEMANQTKRFETLLARLEARGGAPTAAAPYDPEQDLALLSIEQLVGRWQHVASALDRYRDDPLQREPIETERGRVEAELRARGAASIAALARLLPTIDDSWKQTRLLSHVVSPIGGAAAHDLALEMFEDPAVVAGVRLFAAQIAMESHRDRVLERLVGLLENPDPTFNRPEEILYFFRNNPTPAAGPVLLKIARDPTADGVHRSFAIQALSKYGSPEVVEALKEIVEFRQLELLRVDAARSLVEILGKESLDYFRHLKPRLETDDAAMHGFIDAAEAQFGSS
jgi:hypothetical protein